MKNGLIVFIIFSFTSVLKAQVFNNLSDPKLNERFANQTRNLLVQKVKQLYQNFIVRGDAKQVRFFTHKKGPCTDLDTDEGFIETQIAKISYSSNLNNEKTSLETKISYYACGKTKPILEESILIHGQSLKAKKMQDYIVNNLKFDLQDNETSLVYSLSRHSLKNMYRVKITRKVNVKHFIFEVYYRPVLKITEENLKNKTIYTVKPFDLDISYPMFGISSKGLRDKLRIVVNNSQQTSQIFIEDFSRPTSVTKAQDYITAMSHSKIGILENAFTRYIREFPSTEIVSVPVGDTVFFQELISLRDFIQVNDNANALIYVNKLIQDIKNGKVGISEKQ